MTGLIFDMDSFAVHDGPGIRLADHKDRKACGKCGYYEKK